MLQHFELNRQQKSRHYISVREGERVRIVRTLAISRRDLFLQRPRGRAKSHRNAADAR